VIGLVPSYSMRNGLEEATRSYAKQLDGSPVQEHLLSRGITKEAQDYFSLGYVGDPSKGHEKYVGAMSIPYLTRSGVVTIRFRTFGRGAKYLSFPGAKPRPFNVDSLRSSGSSIYITEGELDAISGWCADLDTVGLPGVETWLPVYARMFRFRDVVVVADGDEPGLRFAEGIARDIERCTIIQCPPDQDLNSVLQKSGVEGVRKLVGLGG